MAYLIRFKFIDRQTGKEVKGSKASTLLLLSSGQPAIMREDFYTYVNTQSCRDYELHVALEKDSGGKWLYKKIGH